MIALVALAFVIGSVVGFLVGQRWRITSGRIAGGITVNVRPKRPVMPGTLPREHNGDQWGR